MRHKNSNAITSISEYNANGKTLLPSYINSPKAYKDKKINPETFSHVLYDFGKEETNKNVVKVTIS